jgi:hypothetical protein
MCSLDTSVLLKAWISLGSHTTNPYMDAAGQGNGLSTYVDFDTGHRRENLNAVGRLADKRQFPGKVQENSGALGGGIVYTQRILRPPPFVKALWYDLCCPDSILGQGTI